jgi:hypothetical protein
MKNDNIPLPLKHTAHMNRLAETISEVLSLNDEKSQSQLVGDALPFHGGISSSCVKLSVGGRHFFTARATLINGKSKFLRNMFLGGPFQPTSEADGFIFIDRDGTFFAKILEYLRTGQCRLCTLSESDLLDLEQEAQFYGVQDLVEDIIRTRKKKKTETFPDSTFVFGPGK